MAGSGLSQPAEYYIDPPPGPSHHCPLPSAPLLSLPPLTSPLPSPYGHGSQTDAHKFRLDVLGMIFWMAHTETVDSAMRERPYCTATGLVTLSD